MICYKVLSRNGRGELAPYMDGYIPSPFAMVYKEGVENYPNDDSDSALFVNSTLESATCMKGQLDEVWECEADVVLGAEVVVGAWREISRFWRLYNSPDRKFIEKHGYLYMFANGESVYVDRQPTTLFARSLKLLKRVDLCSAST